MIERYDLRVLADGASSAWDDSPEFLRPILRDCIDGLLQAAEEIERLQEKPMTGDNFYLAWATAIIKHGVFTMVAVQADTREDAAKVLECLGHKILDADAIQRVRISPAVPDGNDGLLFADCEEVGK